MAGSHIIKRDLNRNTSEIENLIGSLKECRRVGEEQCHTIREQIRKTWTSKRSEIENAKCNRIRLAEKEFNQSLSEFHTAIEQKNGFTFAPWDDPNWDSFDIGNCKPDSRITRIGTFVAAGENAIMRMPAVIPILGGKNLLLKAQGNSRQRARMVLRNVTLRLLSSVPPGKLRLTFIDPVELGSTAAGFVGALPDFLTTGIAWHEEQDIEEQLSLIETRIASIKTKYLGVRFPSIDHYNAEAGTIEEPYWLVVVSDCPVRFRESALQKLVSIAKNGPPAGVYLAAMVDEGQRRRGDDFLSELAQTASSIVCSGSSDCNYLDEPVFRDVGLHLDLSPPPQIIERVVAQISQTAGMAQNVRVDWEPTHPDEWWTCDSRSGLRVPIGTYGARKTQFFEIDEKLLNSALIIGKPGSGKSRLLHVLINGLTTRYAPSELTLYLLDCKQVEFKDYATYRLPHAHVVAVESEREFGLSVLRRLNKELDDRKTEFSAAGETSLSTYRTRTGRSMPRVLLIIDEFQELLNVDDALAREAASILDRLVRLGRALGINIVLASQTLAGQTTLQSSTRSQIPIRIVLQCSDSDSTVVLSNDNDEARLLERPGEAIYNSTNGRREGNNRFQVSWLSDEVLEALLPRIAALAVEKPCAITRRQVIFDGNALADVRQNYALAALVRKESFWKEKGAVFAWLGEPIEMKEATAAVFKRQSRSNLIIVGQNEHEQACMSMLMAGMVSIAVQQPSNVARFIVMNLSDPTTEWSVLPAALKQTFPHDIQLVGKTNFQDTLKETAEQIDKLGQDSIRQVQQNLYLIIIGLHRERNLRRVDAPRLGVKADPAAPVPGWDLLSKICREGPPCGVHSLIWCDTFSSFERVFNRKEIDEFSLRVALQMSDSDSRLVVDSDAANKIGPRRAVFFDDEQHGRIEKFRPYSLPDSRWIEEVARNVYA